MAVLLPTVAVNSPSSSCWVAASQNSLQNSVPRHQLSLGLLLTWPACCLQVPRLKAQCGQWWLVGMCLGRLPESLQCATPSGPSGSLPLHPCSWPRRDRPDLPLQLRLHWTRWVRRRSFPQTKGREGMLDCEGAPSRSTAHTDVLRSPSELHLVVFGDPQQPYFIPGSPSQHPCSWMTLSASGLGFGSLCHLLGSKVKVGWEPWPTLY